MTKQGGRVSVAAAVAVEVHAGDRYRARVMSRCCVASEAEPGRRKRSVAAAAGESGSCR